MTTSHSEQVMTLGTSVGPLCKGHDPLPRRAVASCERHEFLMNVLMSSGIELASMWAATSTAEASKCPRIAVPFRGFRICLPRTSRSAAGGAVSVKFVPTEIACGR